ncbi:RHS repeat protein [Mesobacillus foraminis]|uniref:RHS repeat-associated core domain-containing protein n=1 Tax=Mesobacillus foraminis TaxID=279826 RepID=UPI001BE97ED5|nr:RHS repeat-associated core domain-containing protein [Mesobacillus foraminis]MBT2757912.1 RHS repeat protein [Mesobacillus foraminis]
MKKASLLNKMSIKKQINKLVVSVFTISSILYTIPPIIDSKIGIQKASAVITDVADSPNLGEESYWNFYTEDLGAGWSSNVNTATGNLIIKKSLFNIPGRSLPLDEGIIYNALTQQDIGVGPGWTLFNGLFLQENSDGSVTFKDEDATNHIFTKNSDGSYTPPVGVYFKLSKDQSGVFSLEDKDKSVYLFENGRIKSLTDEKGNKTTLSYNSNNNLSTLTDPSGRTLTYLYDSVGKLVSITDPANQKITFSYDSGGRLTSVTDIRNNKTLFEYDELNRLKAFIDANNHKTLFNYDSKGRLSQIIDARSSISDTFATIFEYNETNLSTTITDPAGKKSTYTHNTNGNMTQYKNGAGDTYSYQWNENELVTETDSKGSTSLEYNSSGNITQVTDTISSTENITTNIQYDSKNNPVEVIDSNQNKIISRYDSNSNEISTVNPQRLEADTKSYDSNGNVISSTKLGAPTYNLLENGSFERQDSTTGDFIAWYKGGKTSAISSDYINAYGTKSAKISGTTPTSAYLYSDLATISAGDKITLSASGRLENVSNSNDGGAGVSLYFYDANDQFIDYEHSGMFYGDGNVKYQVTATAPANSTYVLAMVELYNESGTVWFDGLQMEKSFNLEEGHILTDFNFVENSGFEWGEYIWQTGGTPNAVNFTSESKWSGSKSVKIDLTTNGDGWVESIDIPLKNDGPFTLSGFIKTDNLTGTGARIEIDYYDSMGQLLDYATTKLVTGTQDFTRHAISTTPPTNAVKARVSSVVWSATGIVYFDDIKLTPLETTLYEYDNTGNNLTVIKNSKEEITRFTYDAIGNQTSITDPKNYKTSFTYDGNNNLTSVTDPLLGKTFYEYDPVNLQVSIRDTRSASSTDNTYKTTFNYDELNNITSIIDPLGRSLVYTYDKAGNKQNTTNPDGEKVVYEYDGANRLSKKSYLGATQYWDYNYDTAGNITKITDDQVRSYNFSYDDANRLKQYTDLFGYSLNYQLDKVGNITNILDSNNKNISYSYGTNNQIMSIKDTSGKYTNFRYDGSGRPFQIIFGNNIKRTFEYDSEGEIIDITDSGNPENRSITYTYDANGNITSIYGVDYETFTYDKLNRLISWTDGEGKVTSYEYDAVGNLTKKGNKTFTFNKVNEVTNTGFTYDLNGNMTSDGNFNYFYNHENQLVKVTKVSDDSVVATYTYDYRGLRISKTTDSGTIYFHWDDQERLVRESDSSGNTLNIYMYDNDNQLIAFEKNGKIYYVHKNHRGDILSITDENRNKVATYKYGPWGEFLGKTGTVDIPIRYAGYYFDYETGLYYLKARYYNPEFGRFLTKDDISYGEITEPLSLNPYAYVHGNPISLVDPDGNYAIYFVPGIGQVALIGTTVVVGGYAVYKAGSWIYKAAKDYIVKAQNNKQIKKRIDGLQNQINKHKQKIRDNPRSSAKNHWEKEIRTWENEIARLKKRLK